MGFVVTIEDVTPAARYDSVPWETIQVYEAASAVGTFALIDTQSISPVDADPAHPATRNLTTSNATFEHGYYKLRFSDALGGTQDTDVISVGSALLTLSDLKAALGVASGDVDPVRDKRLTQAIRGASAAVSAYADRDWVTSAITEQRSFEYDGSGFLDIDDCASITAVTYSLGGYDQVLPADQWRAEPFGHPVFTYLVLPTWGPGFSPEMGFTRNLDVLYREGGFTGIGPTVKVDATWGWTTVPEEVKQAVIWAALSMSDPASEQYVSESIAGYSHTRDSSRGPVGDALPDRVKSLLAPYVRYKVG